MAAGATKRILILGCAGVAAALNTASAGAAPSTPTVAERIASRGISQFEIAAGFTQRSYAPETRAWLRVWAHTRSLTAQVFVSGPGNSRFNGKAVTSPRTWPWAESSWPRTVSIKVGPWPSGLYFIRLRARDGRTGFAPFVVRPSAGTPAPRIGIILSTNTWQAYNFRDMDGNGVGDTWYADPSVHVVNLARPYLPPGMPPAAGRGGVFPFLRWLYQHGKSADFYADDDFSRFPSGRWLARRYAIVAFAGHEEYVSPTEYDLTVAARNRGLNLAFISANNFFYRATRTGNRLYGRTRWRDLGRPEAALVGVQYVGWWESGRYPMRPYVVTGALAAPWMFKSTGLSNGERFGRFGIEVDARAPSSPAQTKVLARIRDIFGPGKSAEMTYYRTSRGAKVFAAGVLNFTRRADLPLIDKLLQNIFTRLEVR